MSMQHCPSAEELEAFVDATRSDSRLQAHVAECPRCSEALRTIRADRELVLELRGSEANGANSRTRNRLMTICRHAAVSALKDSTKRDPDG
ncbi:MAG: hypothetical protein DCC65_07970 [Planctomycetota bacterium]|nr:MAG: hypothetical protein DCC65_07970 [Planctomycetota bacterium]